MSASNPYPEGMWIISVVVLAIYGYRFLWRKWKVRTFFSRYLNIAQDNFPSAYIENALDLCSENSDFGFSIIRHTTVSLGNAKVPVIFGYVDYPSAGTYGPTISRTRAFFTFSDVGTMTWLLEKYPKILTQACENEIYKVCWIKSIRLLEREFKRSYVS